MLRQSRIASLLALAALGGFSGAIAQEPGKAGGPTPITNSIGMKLLLIPAGDFMMGSSPEEIQEATQRGKVQFVVNLKAQLRALLKRARNLTDEQFEQLFESYLYSPQFDQQWKMQADTINSQQPRHLVRITKPFYLGQYPVTLGEFVTFYHDANYKLEMERDGKMDEGKLADGTMGKSANFRPWAPGGWQPNRAHPAVWVTWNDAVEFCRWLSNKEGKEYRLPTEAQWEYACRARSATPYYFGDSENELANYAWYGGNGGWGTKPVGEKRPNAWGLYDMHGNAWEWCADWYAGDYYAQSPSEDPTGPASGSCRVFRGGGWINAPRNCRSADRNSSWPDHRSNGLGFRVSRVAD